MAFGRLGSLGKGFGRLGGSQGGGTIPGTMRAGTGSFVLTGNDANLLNLVMTADVGAFTLTGNDVTLTASGGGGSTAGEMVGFPFPITKAA